jgi:lipoate-protein ligase A
VHESVLHIISNQTYSAYLTGLLCVKLLDLTLPSPAENLACDEVLLDLCEETGGDGVLRFWEPQSHFVVVGYANHVAKEANLGACEAEGIPILRRCSGGGTVLQGPGCLNYSLIAKIDEVGPLNTITSANRFIMERNRAALESKIQNQKSKIEVRGHTDLAITHHLPQATSLKFSGNAQRRKKHFLLFHGTFLLEFDIQLVEKYLRMPSKEPDYRHNRSHKNFLTNLSLSADLVKRALRDAWSADEALEVVPHDAIALLVRDKYVTKEWNFKF